MQAGLLRMEMLRDESMPVLSELSPGDVKKMRSRRRESRNANARQRREDEPAGKRGIAVGRAFLPER